MTTKPLRGTSVKASRAAEILAALAKQDASDLHVEWCAKILGERYNDWWARNKHRQLINAKATRPEHHRARWKLVQLAKSDLELRPESLVEIPDALLQARPGRHQRTCTVCGVQFESSRSDKVTCSTRCRVRKFRQQ